MTNARKNLQEAILTKFYDEKWNYSEDLTEEMREEGTNFCDYRRPEVHDGRFLFEFEGAQYFVSFEATEEVAEYEWDRVRFHVSDTEMNSFTFEEYASQELEDKSRDDVRREASFVIETNPEFDEKDEATLEADWDRLEAEILVDGLDYYVVAEMEGLDSRDNWTRVEYAVYLDSHEQELFDSWTEERTPAIEPLVTVKNSDGEKIYIDEKNLLTTAAAAELLGVSIARLNVLIKTFKVKAYQLEERTRLVSELSALNYLAYRQVDGGKPVGGHELHNIKLRILYDLQKYCSNPELRLEDIEFEVTGEKVSDFSEYTGFNEPERIYFGEEDDGTYYGYAVIDAGSYRVIGKAEMNR